MENFTQYLDYLQQHGLDLAVSILSIIFGLVILIVQVKKYLMYKQQVKKDKEFDMNYRTENYQSAKGYDKSLAMQIFKRVVPVYELDEATNDLVVVGTKDLQELVQSSRDCGLDVVLEKYGVLPPDLLPRIDAKSDEVIDLSDVREDLHILADYNNELDELRKRYEMPFASPSELLAHISGLKANFEKHIEEAMKSNNKEDKNEV